MSSKREVALVDSFTNFKRRDGKRSPYDGGAGISKALLAIFVKLPLLLCVLGPFVAVYSLMAALLGLCGIGKAKRVTDPNLKAQLEDDSVDETAPPLAEREFDLILFGATGFTGKLTAEWLAKHAHEQEPLRWAIAGRNEAALRRVRDALDMTETQLPVVVADSFDDASLEAMCRRTRVVLSTVGPFAKYGIGLVRACARTGCGYIDSAGEASFARFCVAAFRERSQKTGARIVPMCGNDCVPFDVLLWRLNKEMQARSVHPAGEEDLKTMYALLDGAGGVSGGTVDTFLYHMRSFNPPRNDFNPMDSERDGTRSDVRLRGIARQRPGWSSVFKSWFGWFVLSGVNKECVRRSNVLERYGKRLTYDEQIALPSLLAAAVWTIDMLTNAVFVYNPVMRRVAFALGLLPQPGQGPSRSAMENGYLLVRGCAVGSKGTQVRGQMYFNLDTLYLETARMLAVSALCLVDQIKEDPESVRTQGGVFTPAHAFGAALLQRMLDTGTEFEILK